MVSPGATQYGFTSADSDIDLKGLYLAPSERLLGLGSEPRNFDRLETFEGVECDLTLHEVGQALRGLLRGNGNMLERILSPFQLFSGPEPDALSRLARASVSRQFFDHYSGYFRGVCREHERAKAPTAKRLLYAYRVALTGTHLLRTGELEADLVRLAQLYDYPDALTLIERKRAGAEKSAVPAPVDGRASRGVAASRAGARRGAKCEWASRACPRRGHALRVARRATPGFASGLRAGLLGSPRRVDVSGCERARRDPGLSDRGR